MTRQVDRPIDFASDAKPKATVQLQVAGALKRGWVRVHAKVRSKACSECRAGYGGRTGCVFAEGACSNSPSSGSFSPCTSSGAPIQIGFTR